MKSIWLKPTATTIYPRPKGRRNYPGQLDFFQAHILKILGIIIDLDIVCPAMFNIFVFFHR